MSQLYGDDFDSVASGRPLAERLRRAGGAAVFLVAVAAMGLWAYRLGTRDAAEVPIIRAMEGPARVQPADPGGLRAAHQGLEVNEVLAGRAAPVPDPAARAVAAPTTLSDEDAPQGELVIAAPLALPDEALAAEGDLRMPVDEDAGIVAAAPSAQDDTAGVVSTEALVAQALGLAPGDVAAEAAAETSALAPEAAVVDTRPIRRPANLPVVRAAAPAPAAPVAAPAAPAAAPAAREASSLSAGTRLVQLGAYDSEALTREAWSPLWARNGDLLASKSLYVERATGNARVFYRLRVAGFENTDQTRRMCEALRARGVDCIPVTLQ